MLRHYRRLWALWAAALLSAPLIICLFAPDSGTISADEARPLAPLPSFPPRPSKWKTLPVATDAYLRDHFGLRHFLMHTDALVSQVLLRSGNAQVLIGHDGWMFYRGDDLVLQSAGLVVRDSMVTATADFLAKMHGILAARGIKFIVASPPNSATIYADMLPGWARNTGRRTEYDLLLEALAARGVPAVDLRPPLRAGQFEGKTYHEHDTHWTVRGSIDGFNATAVAAGHPDWWTVPKTVLGPPTTIVGGDLARMLGIGSDVTERDEGLTLPPVKREVFGTEPAPPYLATADRAGPTIMIIGDSFTVWQFAPVLLLHTGRMAWLPHQSCGFEWRWIDKFHPDEVWWMPTERYFVCMPGARPVDFPPE
jgi:hypothetical protein